MHGLEAVVGIKFLDARVYFMSDLPAHVRSADVRAHLRRPPSARLLSTLYPAWRGRAHPAGGIAAP